MTKGARSAQTGINSPLRTSKMDTPTFRSVGRCGQARISSRSSASVAPWSVLVRNSQRAGAPVPARQGSLIQPVITLGAVLVPPKYKPDAHFNEVVEYVGQILGSDAVALRLPGPATRNS